MRWIWRIFAAVGVVVVLVLVADVVRDDIRLHQRLSYLEKRVVNDERTMGDQISVLCDAVNSNSSTPLGPCVNPFSP